MDQGFELQWGKKSLGSKTLTAAFHCQNIREGIYIQGSFVLLIN